MMGHNVECHIKAVQRAQQLMDIECAKHKPDWRMWSLEGSRLQGGPKQNTFNNLFEVEVTKSDEVDLEDVEDEKMIKLMSDLGV